MFGLHRPKRRVEQRSMASSEVEGRRFVLLSAVMRFGTAQKTDTYIPRPKVSNRF